MLYKNNRKIAKIFHNGRGIKTVFHNGRQVFGDGGGVSWKGLTFTFPEGGFLAKNSDEYNLWYSTDQGQTWSEITYDGEEVTGEVSVKGNNNPTLEEAFWIDGSYSLKGNIMSLLTDNFNGLTEFPEGTGNGVFKKIFNGGELTDASGLKLPVMVLIPNCYEEMFGGCQKLTAAPALPATTLAENCYYNMFYGCTQLTSAPELPATTLKNGCYVQMFQMCSSLNRISVDFSAYEESATTNWVYGVVSRGTFYNNGGADIPVGNSGIPTNWTEVKSVQPLTFTFPDSGRVSMYMYGNGGPSLDYEYSTDKVNWERFTGQTPSAKKIYLRGNNTGTATDENNFFYLSTDFGASVSGELNSLIREDLRNSQNVRFTGLFYSSDISDASGLKLPEVVGQNSLIYLFGNCQLLTDAPTKLPTHFGNYAFQQMFYGCTQLTTTPELPATSLTEGCYAYMFYGCSNLTSAPVLPAVRLTDYCYYNMFGECTRLTTAPVLPATTLAESCYYEMFFNCQSLTSAPVLPATTLRNYCYYNMFYGCRNLNEIRVSFTTNAGTGTTTNWVYGVASSGTFYNDGDAELSVGIHGIPAGWTEVKPGPGPEPGSWGGLTLEYPTGGTLELGVTTTTYPDMSFSFDGVSWIKLDDRISVPSDYKVYIKGNNNQLGTSSSKYTRFIIGSDTPNVKVSGNIMSLLYGDDYEGQELTSTYNFPSLFRDQTNLVDASGLELPAMTLTNYCYRDMFNGCSNLTKAPELPATTLATSCYNSMFKNCSSLQTAPVLPASTMASTCYSNIFNGCSLINIVEVYITLWSRTNAATWLSNCAASGVVYNNGYADIPLNDTGGVPVGWVSASR